jgi:hypothetical protein
MRNKEKLKKKWERKKNWKLMLLFFVFIYDRLGLFFHERSYNENCTPSRPLWEVKSHLARSVVRWVTTCEARVLFVVLKLPTFISLLPIIRFVFLFSLSSSFLIYLILILSRDIVLKLKWLSRESNPRPLFSSPHRIIVLLFLGIFCRKTENSRRGWSVGYDSVRSIRKASV